VKYYLSFSRACSRFFDADGSPEGRMKRAAVFALAIVAAASVYGMIGDLGRGRPLSSAFLPAAVQLTGALVLFGVIFAVGRFSRAFVAERLSPSGQSGAKKAFRLINLVFMAVIGSASWLMHSGHLWLLMALAAVYLIALMFLWPVAYKGRMSHE
jgi:hypothetical protein